MALSFWKKLLLAVVLITAGWLGIRYVLPVLLPFLVGGMLALAAEPAVAFGEKKLHLSRGFAAGLGVTVTLTLLLGLLWLAAALTVRELGHLAGSLPDLEAGAQVLEDWLLSLADRAPERIRVLAQRSVLEFFDDGTALMRQVSDRLPGVVTTVVSGVGTGVLGIGTGLLSSFLISARLPALRHSLSRGLPGSWEEKYLPALRKLRASLWGWVKAQGKLILVTWGVVSVGFLLLRISYGPVWAFLVALVDAIPILGTGTVLIPWSVVCLLQGDTLQAVGLLCTYAAAAIIRTVLEPRLVGRQLGLDPLATLVALYAGFRLWGIPGLLLTPILASAVKSLME